MPHSRMLPLATAGFLVVVTPSPTAQLTRTIPEVLANAATSVVHVAGVPSGRAASVDVILRQTDIVVRGVVGKPTSYLSDDQRMVFTDYPIIEPVILFSSQPVTSGRPGMPSLTATLEGGTIEAGGLSFTWDSHALPALESGTECLLLLTRVGGKYFVAGSHYGAFAIGKEKLMPLTRKQNFASEYRHVSASSAVQQIAMRRLLLAQQQEPAASELLEKR